MPSGLIEEIRPTGEDQLESNRGELILIEEINNDEMCDPDFKKREDVVDYLQFDFLN